jgi:hypothetical protein
VSGDGDGVRLRRPERGVEIAELRVAAAEFGVQLRAGFGRTGDETDDLKAGQAVVGEGMGPAHVAGADAEDAYLLHEEIRGRAAG